MSNSAEGRGKTALVTGASSGIGYEFAKILARQGYSLVLVARGAETLKKLAEELKQQYGTTVKVIAKDLSSASAPTEVVAEIEQATFEIDVLINNAGFADYGPFVDSDLQKQLEMLQLNMVTLTHLTRLLLPGMVKRRSGKILNVASTAAFMPGPLMSVYYATKAYVLSFSEALANELKGAGVSVTALCPGPTQSGFQQKAAMEDSKLVSGKKLATSAEVAEAGYKAMLAGKTLIIPGSTNRLQVTLVKFLPRGMVAGIVRNAQANTGH